MKFGPLAVRDAEGAVLAHSLELPDGRLRKGLILNAESRARLERHGVGEVIAAQLEPGDVHEDAAAERLARALVPDPAAVGLRLGRAATGRVNIHATTPGVAWVSAARIRAVNAVHPMITVATVPEWQRMAERGMVATVKIIAYAVPGAALEAACDRAHDRTRDAAGEATDGALSLRPARRRKATLVQTFVGGERDGAGRRRGRDGDRDKGADAIALRLTRIGAVLQAQTHVRHEVTALTEALTEARAAGSEVILILTGSATSDPEDVGPAALRRAGGQVTRFGMPVDPGNLLFLGSLGDIPVIGLPGCARSPALNGADWVLERVLCGVPVTDGDIAAMGVGGLLKEIPTRPQPRDPRP